MWYTVHRVRGRRFHMRLLVRIKQILECVHNIGIAVDHELVAKPLPYAYVKMTKHGRMPTNVC